MTADARLSTSLPHHPKTEKLHRRLGADGCWALVCLFLWVAANRTCGDLAGLSDEDIEIAAKWTGEGGVLVRALREVRFLDGEPGELRIHDWGAHNPWAAGASMRSAKGRWNAMKRHHGEAVADRLVPEYVSLRFASSNASSTTSSNAPSPYPSPSPKQEQSSLRPDMSSTAPDVPKTHDIAQRLGQITDDAISTFNASPLVKANGGCLAAVRPKVGREKRQGQVRRCLRTARAICAERYGSQKVEARFWQDYFTTAHADDFHAGRQQGGKGHENWKPDFEFLTREDVMLKLYDRASEDVA